MEPSLAELANDALQAEERLHLSLRKFRDTVDPDVFKKSIATLDNLREIKASLDGSGADFISPRINDSFLQSFKQLTLMHVPSSITQEVKEKFQNLIFKTFKGTCKKLLCAVLVTCPWYEATQRERGEQARHNTVFVVHMSEDKEFMAPVNHHVLDQAFVMDEGWLSAVELSTFTRSLSKGKTKYVEVLYCTEQAVLFEDSSWKTLRATLDYKTLMGLKGFIEGCKGQSVKAIGKKGKEGKFRLNESTTFREFCDSFRLMHHLQNVSMGLPPCISPLDVSDLSAEAKKGGQLLQSLYQDPDVSKRDIFDTLIQWRDNVSEQLKDFKSSTTQEVDRILGNWQLETRLDGRTIKLSTSPHNDYSKLVERMEEIGGPVARLRPEQIILVSRAGSYMYGLNTPNSDIDYIVIYADTTERIFSACTAIKDCFENRGPDKPFEYGAYEARLFGEMLLKGSVVITELVFAKEHEYMNADWKTLCEKRDIFVTEKCIQQYLGLIRNNFNFLESLRERNTKQERKLFYQIFHKMDSLDHMLNGKVPPVKCTGSIKDFIMDIRTKPQEGPSEKSNLLSTAKEQFSKILSDLANRKTRLKENMDYNVVLTWLMSVRNVESSCKT